MATDPGTSLMGLLRGGANPEDPAGGSGPGCSDSLTTAFSRRRRPRSWTWPRPCATGGLSVTFAPAHPGLSGLRVTRPGMAVGGDAVGQLVLIRRPRTPPEAHRSPRISSVQIFSVQGVINASPSTPAQACFGHPGFFFSEPCGLCGCPLSGLLSLPNSAAHSTDPLSGSSCFQPPTDVPNLQPQSTALIHRLACPAGDASWRVKSMGAGEATGLMRGWISNGQIEPEAHRCPAGRPAGPGVKLRRIGGNGQGAAPGRGPARPRPLAAPG